MNTYKKNAIMIGVLFIITMTAGLIESILVIPVLQGQLNNISQNETLIKTGVLLLLVLSIGIVGIALFFYPVLKKHNETIAITYVSLRSIECIFLIVGAISSLFLLSLSQQLNNSGSDIFIFQTIANLALKVRFEAYQISMIILGLNSMLLNYLLYKTRLVPRWLSIWGFTGYALLFTSAILDICGIIDSLHGTGMIMYIPGGLWEFIVFPIWLFIKGFNQNVIASGDKEFRSIS